MFEAQVNSAVLVVISSIPAAALPSLSLPYTVCFKGKPTVFPLLMMVAVLLCAVL